MKRLYLIVMILALSVSAWAGGPISFGGSGSGDMLKADNLSGLANNATARSNIGVSVSSDVQAYSANLTTWGTLAPSANMQTLIPYTYAQMRTALGLDIGTNVQAYSSILADIANTATSANKIYGINTAGTIGLYGNIRQDNSAAQFADAANATKLILIDPSGGTGTLTIKNEMTATGTFAVPSDFTSADGAVGKTSSQTLTNKILTAPHIQGYEFIASETTTLFATQAYGGRVNNFGQNAVATQTLPTAAYGMDVVFTMGTATSFSYGITAGGPLLYYGGGISTNAWIAAPAVGDYFVIYSFKTGTSTWAWILKNGQGTIATS